jgi:transposase InsO family protein
MLPIVLEELSGMRERPMIMSMLTTARPQHRHDHRFVISSNAQRTRAYLHAVVIDNFSRRILAWRSGRDAFSDDFGRLLT